MNGYGIAAVVALGVAIGFALGAPAGFPRQEMVITIIFWSLMSGFIFEAYRIAFSARPPFKR